MKLEDRKYAARRFKEKGFNDFTQQKLFDYLETHSQLYGDIIPDRENIDRIAEILKENIQIIDFDEKEKGVAGETKPFLGKIRIDSKNSLHLDLVCFHEIDHIASCNITKMREYEEERKAREEFKRKQDEKFMRENPNMDEETLHKYMSRNTRDDIDYSLRLMEERKNDVILGIEKEGNGLEKSGRNLNEGITQMKTIDYCQIKKIPYNIEDSYFNYVLIAEQLGRIIGRKNLLMRQHQNDRNGIEREVREKTGGKLDFEELVSLTDQLEIHIGREKYRYFLNKINANTGMYRTRVKENIKAKHIFERRDKEISEQAKLAKQIQKKLDEGFIASRCKSLGMEYDAKYYRKLPKEEKRREKGILRSFGELNISDYGSSLQTPLQFLKKVTANLGWKIGGVFHKEVTGKLPSPEKDLYIPKLKEEFSSKGYRESLKVEGINNSPHIPETGKGNIERSSIEDRER